MRCANLISNLLIFAICFVIAFFIVIYPLGELLDYLYYLSNSFLNKTGLGFSDGENDPSFLGVLLFLSIIVTFFLMKLTLILKTLMKRTS